MPAPALPAGHAGGAKAFTHIPVASLNLPPPSFGCREKRVRRNQHLKCSCALLITMYEVPHDPLLGFCLQTVHSKMWKGLHGLFSYGGEVDGCSRTQRFIE